MKKLVNIVFSFLFWVTGLEWLMSEIDCRVQAYKISLNMTPKSYKYIMFFLGAFGTMGWMVTIDTIKSNIDGPRWKFEQSLSIDPVQAKEIVDEVEEVEEIEETKKDRSVDELADYIWFKESTRGKNNFSKCEAIGKINGIGYRIPGDGSYTCFDSHDDEMSVLKGWIIDKKALGWSELKMLCTYSGHNYSECKK